MAMSMLRSSTAVSVTYKNEIIHAATGVLVESRAQSKKSFPIRAPSRSLSSAEKKSVPPSSSAQVVWFCVVNAEELDGGSESSTVQLAAKATSEKSSSTRK
eukprot:scaffold48648_cov40-Phaeocystis_antarctica.AAC.2